MQYKYDCTIFKVFDKKKTRYLKAFLQSIDAILQGVSVPETIGEW